MNLISAMSWKGRFFRRFQTSSSRLGQSIKVLASAGALLFLWTNLAQAQSNPFHQQGGNFGKPINRSCDRVFSPRDGSIGEIGQLVLREMTRPDKISQFTKAGSLTPVCPRFDQMSANQRLEAWLWFWTVLFNEESDCNERLDTHIPRTAYGICAVEKDRPSWRGQRCRGNYRDVQTQVACCVSIMNRTQLDRGRGLLWSKSYWGPLRRYNRQIIPNMRRYAPCFG